MKEIEFRAVINKIITRAVINKIITKWDIKHKYVISHDKYKSWYFHNGRWNTALCRLQNYLVKYPKTYARY